VLYTLVALYCISAFGQQNVTLRSQFTYNQTLNDIWGYSNGEDEYSLVGTVDGLSIVNITNPDSVFQVQYIPDANSNWRDIKTWGHYAYVVNETGTGLLIVDLDSLPSSVDTFRWTGGVFNFDDAHNVFIDENGFCYLVGGNTANGGVKILDLNSDPTNPSLAGVYDIRNVHDLFVRGDTMWTAEIQDGLVSVVDVSDKANPSVMATFSTPHNFTHNCWLSEDGNTLITTDEVSGAFVVSYDVSDLNSISESDRYQSSPGQNVIPHNTFWINNFAVTSYYTDGVTIVDANRPSNLVEVGYFDTSPLSGQSFNGCWGVYPFLPSGNIIASDQQQGLFVLTPNYERACYLEGTVVNSSTTFPLNGVQVEILSTDIQTVTTITGEFKTGTGLAGTYSVEFSKPGYFTKVENGVVLQPGVITNLNIGLVPVSNFSLNGWVTDSSGTGLNEADVEFTNGISTFNATTDSTGLFSIPVFYADTYNFYVGKWGYQTTLQSITINGPADTPVAQLAFGYHDDFVTDQGWVVSGNASTGMWVREAPIGTVFQNNFVNPEEDINGDLGDRCWITGNGAGGVGMYDIDNGRTTITSPPIDLSGYGDPYLVYSRWFYNGGGSGVPNDSMRILLRDLNSVVELEAIHGGNQIVGQWTQVVLRVTDYMPLSSIMFLDVTAADVGPGHLVEAGFDGFQIVDSMPPTPFCEEVVELSVSKITPSSARLQWLPVINAVSYFIRGRRIGVANWTTINVPFINPNVKDVFGLSHNQFYEWQIQAICDTNGTETGPFSKFDTFFTDCFAPDSIWTNPVIATAARLNWLNTPVAAGYEIRGRRTNTSNWANLLVAGNTNSKDVFGLLSGTEYEWMIRTWCDSAGNKKSNYSPSVFFQTAPNARLSKRDWEEQIAVFPNPTSANLFFQFKGMYPIHIQVLSSDGKLFYSGKPVSKNQISDNADRIFHSEGINSCSTEYSGPPNPAPTDEHQLPITDYLTLNTSYLPAGIYFVLFQTKEKTFHVKFIKQ